MTILSDVLRILTLDCRESSHLVSESLDRPLRPAERLAVRLHAIGCWSCRRLRKQIYFIRQTAQSLDEERSLARDALPVPSAEARERIKAALRSAQDDTA